MSIDIDVFSKKVIFLSWDQRPRRIVKSNLVPLFAWPSFAGNTCNVFATSGEKHSGNVNVLRPFVNIMTKSEQLGSTMVYASSAKVSSNLGLA